MEKRVKTRDSIKLAQALRDLAWREYVHKLTGVEQNMESKLIKMLSREMAVVRPNMTIATASSRLQQMLHEMIEIQEPQPEAAPAS